jgi:alkaline phosphatase
MNSRPFIVAVAVVALLAAPLAPAQAPGPASAPDNRAVAKNVILFIGDGLGPATATAARLMRYHEEGTLVMDGMPSVARLRTASLDAQTSDGAASASALLTGVKVRNDVVALDGNARSVGFNPGRDAVRNVAGAENRCPSSNNGGPSTTLLELAIDGSRATGIVTTSRLTAGVAAAAYAHVCHREAEYEVARQAVPGGAGFNTRLGRGIDVMLGGGSAFWRPFEAGRRTRGRPDARELSGELQSQGYTIVSDLTSLNAASATAGSRLFGTFDFAEPDGTGAMSYDLDRDPKREPSLAEMTTKALDVLKSNPKGFVLVVVGGRIGQAARAGNARRALVDTIAFDDAVRVALDKADLSRTLIIATGDHDTTLALIGGGRRGSDILGLHLDPQNGKPDTDANGATFTSLVFGTGPNRPDKRASLDTPTVLQRDYLQESAVRTAVGTNGGSDVVLRASGAGAPLFRGTLDEARVFTLIRRAANL